MRSLRGQLAFFWIILLSACAGLAVVMIVMFRTGVGTQVDSAQALAEQACAAVSMRYAKSAAAPPPATPQIDLLQVLLQLVLIETPHVEGGVWRAGAGFLAYAYPTYEGSGIKRDVPEAEQAHIAEIAGVSARLQQPQTDVVRASREALVLSACPLLSLDKDTVAWTMTRVSLSAIEAQRSLRIGLGILLALVLSSGLWLGAILARGYRHVRRLETQLASSDADAAQPLQATGVKELDLIVNALSRYRSRLHRTGEQLKEAERLHARDQRLAALGRMTGSVAHEIRNPIAAMRLKAENALAGPAARQPEALHVILGQIARLDGLVQSLLAVVQPIQLDLRPIGLAHWLTEHLDAIRPGAEERGLQLLAELAPITMTIDPVHLGRAIDNLLHNAVDHAKRMIVVTLTQPAGSQPSVVITVDDDGPGVSDAVRDRLFEPFASARPQGTGLGLALAREVVLAHGGELIYVRRPNGARFQLELPWHAC